MNSIMNYPMPSLVINLIIAILAATVIGNGLARAGVLPPVERGRIGYIDGLRGYLALSVLAHHFIIWLQIVKLGGTWTAPSVNFFNNMGAGAVALFFMATGCVFYPRIQKGFWATSWIKTYVGRVFRIVPLIAFSVAVITAVIVSRIGWRFDLGYWKSALAWLSSKGEPPLLGYPDSGRMNAYVLWSLEYEWRFYLYVLPAAALVMDFVRQRFSSWTLSVGVLVISLALRSRLPLDGLEKYLPLFAVGMFAYECQEREWVRRILGSSLATVLAVGCLALGMVREPDPYGDLQIALFGFFFVSVACGNSLGGLLKTAGARVLGECSYGIYLLHGIFLSLLFVEGEGLIAGMPVEMVPALLPFVVVGVVGVTCLTYLVVERPGIQAGHILGGALYDVIASYGLKLRSLLP